MAEGGKQKRKHSTDDEDEPPSKPKGKRPGYVHWSQGLLVSMNDPDLVVEKDEQIVVIKDKYPKARHHFLILPKEAKIPNLKSLQPEHLALLKHMHRVGKDLIERTDNTIKFRLGYHAVPSMGHLHMHVISQDFESPYLKNKKHWNSFTTEYFVNSKDIMRMLEKKGKVEFDKRYFQELLKVDLRCHVCKMIFMKIPTLKTHIRTHNYHKD